MTIALLAIAALAAGAAFAFYWQYAALKGSLDGLKKSSESHAEAAAKAQKDRDAAKEELGRKKTEAADLREKLNDLRAKQHKSKEGEKRTKSKAEVELQDDLETARRTLVEAENRADALYKDLKAGQDELTKLRDERKKLEQSVANAQAYAKSAAAAPVVASAAPAAVTEGAAPADPTAAIRSELTETKARILSLENQLREARRKVSEAEEGAKAARGRVSNEKRLAQVQKSELDLFKEKLVWSEKRVVELERLLFDNKIELPVREVAPAPKALELAPGITAREGANTGGEGVVAEAVDYVPEAAADAAPASDAASASDAPGAEAATVAANEAASDASTEGESGPAAVPPLRRPRAEIEATREG